MLLVLQWLGGGRTPDGAVALSIAAAAADLAPDPGRDGLLEVMEALGALEETGRVEVTWPRGPGAEARVSLSEDIREDAARLFGG